jgi:hypothetical protein
LSTTDASSTTALALHSGGRLAISRDVSALLARFVRLDELPSGVSPLAP